MNELLARGIEELRLAWRFRWHGLLIAWVVACAGWLIVYAMPNQYRVSARIHIDTKSMLEPLLGGMTVNPDLNSRVALLTHTVLRRSNLKKIVNKTDLSLGVNGPDQEKKLEDKLRRRIDISRSGRQDLYSISYINKDPAIAQSVVQQLLNILTEEALGSTLQQSSQATAFLKKQLGQYKEQLNSAEEKLAEFKKQHIGSMPDNKGDFYTQLQDAKGKRNQLKNALAIELKKRAELQQQIKKIKKGGHPVSTGRSPHVRSIDSQLKQDRQQLNQLLLKYTAEHPDVISLKAQIARLEKERKKAVANAGSNNSRVFTTSNPVYQEVKKSLNKVNVAIGTLRSKIQQKSSAIANLRSHADQMTETQARLAGLTRNYNVTKAQYNKLLKRLYTAELSQNAQNGSKQLKFRVLDPPLKPFQPIGPHRFQLLSAVLILSLIAGGVFAFFLSQIRPVFMNRRKLADITQFPVLGSVSMAWSSRQLSLQRMQMIVFLASVGVLGIGYVGAVLFMHAGTHLARSFVG